MGRPGRRRLAAGVRPLALAALGLAFACRMALAEAAAVSLIFPPPLTPEVQALPRLVASTAAMDHINAQLSQLDARELSWASGCDTDPPRTYFARGVRIVFAGPRYLGLLTVNESFCQGAAHGAHFAMPLTFDLATGAEVNWPDLFPRLLQDPVHRPHRTDYIIGAQRLTSLYLSHATDMDAECRATILDDNNGYFRAWMSATDQGLVLMPSGLSYASQACADPVALPVATLRAEGFPAPLLAALDNPARLPPGTPETTP